MALKFLGNKHQNKSIRTMIQVCSLGIIIATCCLALVVSIMNGFQHATYQKMQSIYPDIIIDSGEQHFTPDQIDLFFSQDHPNITAHAPECSNQALLTYLENQSNPTMIILKGIDPAKECLVSNITSKIISPKASTLEALLKDNGVMIGKKLAEDLDLEIDDLAYIAYTDESPSPLSMHFKHAPVVITGIFSTGIEDFDNSLVYCNQNFFYQLFCDQGPTAIHVKIKSAQQLPQSINYLSQKLHAHVYSWQDLYPTLLSALKLEKWAMFLVLLLITIVASMNIISLIFMYIAHKQRDITVLLCMGMSKATVRHIFIVMSMCITIPSSIIGLMGAWGIGTMLQLYPCIKLPDNVYDSQYIPVYLELSIFCVILIITILISLLASWYATKNINNLEIVKLLKSY